MEKRDAGPKRVFLAVMIITLVFFLGILPFVLNPQIVLFGKLTASFISGLLLILWVIIIVGYIYAATNPYFHNGDHYHNMD